MHTTRFVLALAAGLLLAAPAASAQNTPGWAGFSVHATPADTALRFTTAGRSFTVLFDGFVADAQGSAEWAPVTRTATFSVALQEDQPGTRLRFTQHLRGGISKDPDARVVVVLVLPDRTETLVFPYGQNVVGGDLFRTFHSTLRYHTAQEYAASVFVRVDRRRPDAAARVDIDSFDVEVSRTP